MTLDELPWYRPPLHLLVTAYFRQAVILAGELDLRPATWRWLNVQGSHAGVHGYHGAVILLHSSWHERPDADTLPDLLLPLVPTNTVALI